MKYISRKYSTPDFVTNVYSKFLFQLHAKICNEYKQTKTLFSVNEDLTNRRSKLI